MVKVRQHRFHGPFQQLPQHIGAGRTKGIEITIKRQNPRAAVIHTKKNRVRRQKNAGGRQPTILIGAFNDEQTFGWRRPSRHRSGGTQQTRSTFPIVSGIRIRVFAMSAALNQFSGFANPHRAGRPVWFPFFFFARHLCPWGSGYLLHGGSLWQLLIKHIGLTMLFYDSFAEGI